MQNVSVFCDYSIHKECDNCGECTMNEKMKCDERCSSCFEPCELSYVKECVYCFALLDPQESCDCGYPPF